MKKLTHAILIVSLSAFFGCDKDGQPPSALSGNFTGKLIAVYPASTHQGLLRDTVSISLVNNKFTGNSKLLSGSYDQYHGSIDGGTYKIVKDSIYLQNVNAYPDIIDIHLVLSGSYHFNVQGDSLIMSKTINGSTYTYRLKKAD